MHKTWIMSMLVGLLLGQAFLAGSVVICTTEDGQTRLEKSDHHDHGHLADQAHTIHHEDEPCGASVCEYLDRAACCQDISLNCALPSLVEVKRMGQSVHAVSQALNSAKGSSLPLSRFPMLPHPILTTDPDVLRSVVLLI